MPSHQAQPTSPIPEPEGADPKEVFTFFGLCSFHAQVLEQGVVNLTVALRCRGRTQLKAEDVTAAFERIDQRRETLGQLWHDVRRLVEVPGETETAVNERIRERNYLFHRFFAEHDIDFLSNPGREVMIAQLRVPNKMRI